MHYYLLTGATGLLGNYLVRDLLLAGVPLAVLVRPNRKQSARQRVEALLSRWDEELGEPLPRPVVLEGDISQEDLGLDANELRWAAEYCGAVIHNAASLTFHATRADAEPYRSNLAGTQHVLDFARNAGIREFHHVSTAYVAGLRTGKILETEVDLGQELGNDYEKSKLASEKLVRAADFLDPPTIYRPGIIIGDAENGYTTTYHGFYAALQLAHTLAQQLEKGPDGRVQGQVVRLSLNGDETKHLVPVDWVSRVMAHVITHRSTHGTTYHLTPAQPVTTGVIRSVLEDSLEIYGTELIGHGQQPADCTEIESLFYDHIRVYNSYWRMDPEFDQTNVRLAAPHLPCPVIDHALLMKLSKTVIDAGFPSPSKKPIEFEFDAALALQPWLELGSKLSTRLPHDRMLGLDLRGLGGGQWQLVVQNGQVVGAETGIHSDRLAVCQTDVQTFADLCQGRTSWEAVFESGAATLQGHGLTTDAYAALLDQVANLAVIG
jgi:thioester reductase-like protein